jgi:hypothetical protein
MQIELTNAAFEHLQFWRKTGNTIILKKNRKTNRYYY